MYLVIERFFVTGYIRMLGGLGENNEHLWKSLKFFDDKAVIYCHLCTPHILSVIVILGCERCRYLCNFHNY